MNRQKSLRKKLTQLFLITLIWISIVSVVVAIYIFNNFYNKKSTQFISDISKQTTTNIEENINKVDELTFNILKNSTIQKSLNILNENELTHIQKVLVKRDIFDAIGEYAMFTNDYESISVVSLKGDEVTYSTNLSNYFCQMFTQDEIFDAKGSTIWTLTDDGTNNICVARAIIDVDTQKPIGYINAIVKEEYIGNIIYDITGAYSSGTFLIDSSNKIMSSNNSEYIGEYLYISDKEEVLLSNHNEFGKNSYLFTNSDLQNGWRLIITVKENEVNSELAFLFVIILIITIISSLIVSIVVIKSVKKSIMPLENLKENMKGMGTGDFSLRVPIVENNEIGELSEAFNKMAEDIEDLVDNAYKLELAQKESEIKFLKMQINPHFLYNTLDTISWMARTQNNMDISEMSMALGELLRANLKQESMITIGEELKNVRNYIFIQEYRFGDKISVEYEIENGVKDYLIPNFILQPLIENSIIHGLEPKIGQGLLTLQIFIFEEMVFFRVVDDGVGMTKDQILSIEKRIEDSDSKDGIGLRNVNKRLRLYYGNSSSLRVTSDIDEGSIICFTIPLSELEKKI